MSLIADSLKKAIKEKSFNVAPGVNLLKHLGAKSRTSTRFDPKEVKRFIVLIVVPATILGYLLLKKPFDPNNKLVSPPVVAKAPAPAPVAQSAPNPPPPSPIPDIVREQENILMIESGMKEVSVLEKEATVVKPKPVAGPKKESPADTHEEKILEKTPSIPPLAQKKPSARIDHSEAEEPATKIPQKMKVADEGPVRIITPMEPEKVPETFARTRATKAKAPSFPTPPEPDIFKNSDYYFNQAIFYQQSRNWEKALTNYSKAAELDANNPDIYNNTGVIYKELRQYDRAIEEFLKAVYLNPDYAKPYNNIGVVYYSKKDFPGAIRNYQKAISIDPKNLEALNNLAVAYKRIDQLEQAKAVLNQALKINLAHAGTHYNLAVLFEEEGNLKSAIHFYQSFIELGATTHPALSAQVKRHIETLK